MARPGTMGRILRAVAACGFCSAALLPGRGEAAAAGQDEHTVALWLFDETSYMRTTLTDAGRNMYDLRLIEPGKLGEGRFGHALHTSAPGGPAVQYANASRVYDEQGFFSQDSWIVKTPPQLANVLTSATWTVEFWLRLPQRPSSRVTLIEYGVPGSPGLQCSYDPQAQAIGINSAQWPAALQCAVKGDMLADGAWHHVALVRESADGAVKLYVDGAAQGESQPAPVAAAADEKALKPGLIGAVYENQSSSSGLENAVNVKAAGALHFYYGEARDLAWREDWRGSVTAPVDGTVQFYVEADDGARLTIGEKVLVDRWGGTNVATGELTMNKGEALPLRVEMRQMGATRNFRLRWKLPDSDWATVPSSVLSHTVADEKQMMSDTHNVVAKRFYFSLGSGWLFDQPAEADFDELRISNAARYTGNFTPASLSRNYGENPPAATVANGLPLLFDGGRGSDTLALGSRKHVFIDDIMIDARQDVQLKMIPPAVDQPTDLTNDKPWESKDPKSFGDSSFYDDDGTLRFMYGHATMWRGSDDNNVLCMATSKDGLHFEKPNLTHVPWAGSESNNIVLRAPVQGRFYKDLNPAAPAEERYKFGAFQMHRGVYLYTSPDGYQWKRNETILAPFDIGGGAEGFWDDQRGSYVMFIRNEGWTDWHAPFGRAVARAESKEPFKPWAFEPRVRPAILLKAWSLPSISTEFPTAFAPKDVWNKNPNLFIREGHVYRSRARKYEWAPDTYVSFHWRLYGIPDHEQRQSDLAVSRDGVHWHVFDEPYLPYGVEFEGAKVVESLAMDGLVKRGDELWQYAELRFSGHRSGQFKDKPEQDVMMRYRQRLDGFVALQAGERKGWMMTRPFVFDGNRLELNVASQGAVRVALLDDAEVPLPGFTAAECDPIKADSVRQVVTWGGQSDVRRLAGKPVRLRLEMENAKVFAFQFVKD